MCVEMYIQVQGKHWDQFWCCCVVPYSWVYIIKGQKGPRGQWILLSFIQNCRCCSLKIQKKIIFFSMPDTYLTWIHFWESFYRTFSFYFSFFWMIAKNNKNTKLRKTRRKNSLTNRLTHWVTGSLNNSTKKRMHRKKDCDPKYNTHTHQLWNHQHHRKHTYTMQKDIEIDIRLCSRQGL
jgi:hypothetical protein